MNVFGIGGSQLAFYCFFGCIASRHRNGGLGACKTVKASLVEDSDAVKA